MKKIPYLLKKGDKIFANPLYRYIKYFVQTLDDHPLIVSANSDASSGFNLSAGGFVSGDFEIVSFIGFETNNRLYTVDIRDKSGNEFMNYPILGRLIFGTPEYPLILPETIYLKANQGLQVKCTDLSGNDLSIYLAFHGIRYYIPENPKARTAMLKSLERRQNSFVYFYTTKDTISLSANETTTCRVTLGKPGYYYVVEKIATYSTGAFEVQIKDLSSNTEFSNVQIHRDLLLSTTQGLPTILPVKHFMDANTDLQFTFTDLSGAPNTIYIVLIGKHVLKEVDLENEALDTLSV